MNLFIVSAVTGISDFAPLLGVPTGIVRSTVELEICAITVGIKKDKPIIKKRKKKLDKTVFLRKAQLNSIQILISKALINSNTGHDDVFLQ